MRLPLSRACRRLLCALPLLSLAGCGGERGADAKNAEAPPLLVFAASDLRDALGEIARAYRAAGGDSATIVFGSTGELAAQIAGGAPADLMFAANADAIDGLAAKGLVVQESRTVYAIGRLAIIARCDTVGAVDCVPLSLRDLAAARVRHVAIANPEHAPYGRAAREALQAAGVYDQLDGRLVLANTVSQAEQFVATGNADAGVVALSLAKRRPWARHTVVDASMHAPLRQTAATMARSGRRAGADSLLAFVRGSAGQEILRRYGFEAATR